MSRYRKVEVAVWHDERFRALSPSSPSGQMLWLYLLTGPRTTVFPGLVVASEAVMADDLGWTVEGFREAFAEAFREGLVEASGKASGKVDLVVLKKALLDSSGQPRDTSRPASPNVLKGWAASWDVIPECDLKWEYLCTLKTFAEGLGKAFAQAFQEGFGKAFAKGRPHPSRNQDSGSGVRNQERESLAGARAIPGAGAGTHVQPAPTPPKPSPALGSDRRIALNTAAYEYARDRHAALITTIDPTARRWTAMPTGTAATELPARTNELLAGCNGAAHENYDDALAKHKHRVDVAVAEAMRPEVHHLRWFTPSRIYASDSFWRAMETSVEQAQRSTSKAADEQPRKPLRMAPPKDERPDLSVWDLHGHGPNSPPPGPPPEVDP